MGPFGWLALPAALAVVVVLAVLVPRLVQAQSITPDVTVATVGTQVTVNGTGFAADETNIQVTFDGVAVVTGITAEPDGSWSTTFNVPAKDGGVYVLDAFGDSTAANQVADVNFTVFEARFANSPSTPAFTSFDSGDGVTVTVDILDQTSGSPNAWSWAVYLDDGDEAFDQTTLSFTSSTQNPSFTFSAGGDYHVRLTATDSTGIQSTTDEAIFIRLIDAAFTAVAGSAHTSQNSRVLSDGTIDLLRVGGVATVNFTSQSSGGGTLNYSWDFNGDGVTDSTQASPGDHTYTTAGTRTVELRVSGPAGTSAETKTALVRVFDDPLVPNFTATPLSGVPSLTVNFTDQTSGNPTNWQWDFENDGTPDSFSQNPSYTYTSGGFKTVTLTASVPDPGGVTAFGLSDTETKASFIQVVEADFALSSAGPFTIGQGQAGVNVSFTDQSQGLTLFGQTRWDWDFGDGNTFTTSTDGERSPTHQYTSSGTFNVSLQVTDPAGTNSKAISSLVTVNKAPVADFSADQSGGAAPLEVQMTDSSVNSPTSWSWSAWKDNGDGSFSEGSDTQVLWNQLSATEFEQGGSASTITVQGPLLRFTEGGAYHVRLTASNSAGSSDPEDRENLVEVLSSDFDARLSGGSFSQSVLTINTGESVEFRDLSDGSVTSRAWDVNDDGVTDSTDAQFTFTFAEGGRFPVSLRVIGPAGSDTEVKGDQTDGFVNVGSTPEVDFNTTSARFGGAPLTVSLQDESVQDGLRDPMSWAWTIWEDDGDGVLDEGADTLKDSSTSQNPNFTISDGGDFHVKLVASNEGGSSSKVEPLFIRTIEAEFTQDQTEADLSLVPSLTVIFTSQVKGTVDTFAWDLDGDGLPDSTSQNPSFTYSEPGSFTVSLTATGPAGSDSEVKVDHIKTFTAPSADFSYTPDQGAAPLEVQFTDGSVGNPTDFEWIFFQDENGNGSPDAGEEVGSSTSQNPTFTFSTGGTFSVQLTATNPGHENPLVDPGIVKTKLNEIDAIRAVFTASVSSGESPVVAFDDLSEGTITFWIWDFDGICLEYGSGRFVQAPGDPDSDCTYLSEGSHTPTLIVFGPAGSSDAERTVQVGGIVGGGGGGGGGAPPVDTPVPVIGPGFVPAAGPPTSGDIQDALLDDAVALVEELAESDIDATAEIFEGITV